MFPGRTGAGKNDEPVNRKKGEFIIPVTGDTGNTPYTPFLVVGSGIAGLYTALKLAETGEVTLVTKETLVESTTAYAQGGIAAALNPGDSPNLHFDDTIKAGAGLCLSKAVRILVQEGMERVKELLDLGVPFDRRDGEPAFTREAAHSRRRILHADGDATGREISRVLMELVTRNPRIKVEEKVFAAALLTGSAGCRGIFTVRKNGAPQALLAGATILATGGCGQIYSATTNPAVATGDGMAMAYRAGAPLADMEFMQFHPTVLYFPPAPRFLISESVRGEGGILLSKEGTRFMPDYHPQAELAPRDIVARAVHHELQKSGSECVYLDLSAIAPSRIKNRFPNIYETCRDFGLDITKDPVPVTPAAHYMMGGVFTDFHGRTGVPHLFSCGEAANPGVHGANRLASNSLLEGLVFGHRIYRYLQKHPPAPFSQHRLHAVLVGETDPSCSRKEHQVLQNLMHTEMGIIRTGQGLAHAGRVLSPASILSAPVFDRGYLELQNMRLVARLMIRGALLRTESRGSHYRSDYPQTDPNWAKRIFLHPNHYKLFPSEKESFWTWEKNKGR